MKKYYIGFMVLGVVCLAAIIWQYALSRGAVSDQRKVSDISQIQSAVDQYAQDKSEAPANLNALELDAKVKDRLSDYEYSHNTDSYTICATFKTDASLPNSSYSSLESEPYYHKKGRQCFTSEIYTFNYDDFYNSPEYNNLYNSEDYNFDSLYQ